MQVALRFSVKTVSVRKKFLKFNERAFRYVIIYDVIVSCFDLARF